MTPTTWGQGPNRQDLHNVMTTDERINDITTRLNHVEHQLTQINDAITELLKTLPLPK